ncbi:MULTISPECIES: MMPL family transporter [Nocardia]|nr:MULTISPECIES: MMPL family transporter [Nocardia]
MSASNSGGIVRGRLWRWGMLMARRRWLVLTVWGLVTLAGAASYPALSDRLGGMDFGVEGSQSQQVDALVGEHFPSFGAEQDVIVFRSDTAVVDDEVYRDTVGEVVREARAVPGVVGVIDPFTGPGQIAEDRRVAIAPVGIDGDMAARAEVAARLQAAVGAAGNDVVSAAVTGYSPVQNDATAIQERDLGRAEAIGLPIALVVLVLALGALGAAVVPIVVAVAGLLLAVGGLLLLSGVLDFDQLVMSMATMIGIGIGIDYAMFVVARFREELSRAGISERRDHPGIAAALGRTLATSGRTILASGIIVMISLSALLVMDAPVFRGAALGVSTAVLATLTAGLTLLPALLAVLGPALNRGALPRRLRPREMTADADASASRWARWARIVMARPVLFGGGTVAVLLLAAAPLLGIRYGLDMGTNSLGDAPSGRAGTVLAENFAPGALSPVEVVATGAGDTPLSAEQSAQVQQFLTATAADARVEAVTPAQPSNGRVLAAVIPAVPFDSAQAETLVRDLREAAEVASAKGGPQILVGGTTAEFVDLADEMTSKLPLVIALVLAASLVFLLIAFASLALPIKAIVMNLLATGAALGLTVAVFQWGWGQSLLGFTSTGFLQVYLPTMVFAILFGLSMDYEVFLIRRMREHIDAGADNTSAVAGGLARTARPITAAAAIMVAVFGSFTTAQILELKQLGFALAVAVAIDAVLIRLVLVPALMRVLGQWNWWLPTLPRRKHRASPDPEDGTRTVERV